MLFIHPRISRSASLARVESTKKLLEIVDVLTFLHSQGVSGGIWAIQRKRPGIGWQRARAELRSAGGRQSEKAPTADRHTGARHFAGHSTQRICAPLYLMMSFVRPMQSPKTTPSAMSTPISFSYADLLAGQSRCAVSARFCALFVIVGRRVERSRSGGTGLCFQAPRPGGSRFERSPKGAGA